MIYKSVDDFIFINYIYIGLIYASLVLEYYSGILKYAWTIQKKKRKTKKGKIKMNQKVEKEKKTQEKNAKQF